MLESLDLPLCEEGQLIIKRTVSVDKAPKISVNGGLATLAALQKLGEHWIDFHGPSEPRRLLKEGCQLELLDLFARAQPRFGRLPVRVPGLASAADRARRAGAGVGALAPINWSFCASNWRTLKLWI